MRTNHTAARTGGAGTSSTVRHETEGGEEFLVAPAVLFQEGVYSYRTNDGGLTREYLPADELTDDPAAWEHTPVTIGHPEVDGQFVSVTDSQAGSTPVGELREVWANETQLRGEVWFRESARGEHGGTAEAIATTLESDGLVEVSPGYVPTVEQTAGRHNGAAYDAIQRAPNPDHFALLPDDTGNCSLAEGCGVGAPRANHAMSNTSDDASLRAGGESVRANAATTGAGTPVAPDDDEGLWRTLYNALDTRFNGADDCGCDGHADSEDGCACDSESDDLSANTAGDDDDSTDGDGVDSHDGRDGPDGKSTQDSKDGKDGFADPTDDDDSTIMSEDDLSERLERLAANTSFDAEDLADMTDAQIDDIDPEVGSDADADADAGASDDAAADSTEDSTADADADADDLAEIAANKAAKAVAEQYEERLNALEEKVEAPEREFEERLNEKLAANTSLSEEAIEDMGLTAKQETLEQATDAALPEQEPRQNFMAVQSGVETRANTSSDDVNVGTGDYGAWLAEQSKEE